MTRSSFAFQIERALSLVGRSHGRDYRYIPSSFDPDDAVLRAYPVHADRTWSSLQRFLTSTNARGVVSRLPSFWQAHFALFDACRTCGIPLFTNDPENMPLGSAALRTAGLDTLVTTLSDATVFMQYLSDRSIPHPQSVFAIIEGDGPCHRLLSSANIQYELHLLPGVPVLEQCAFMARHSTMTFHLTEGFVLDSLSPMVCSTTALGPVPLTSITSAHHVREIGICACGSVAYELV